MIKLDEKRAIVENTPWKLLTEQRLDNEEFYSGFVIKAFRVDKGWNARSMACRLGIKRISAMTRLESNERIGIKLAKELANIFSIAEYRIFRERRYLEKYRPSEDVFCALEQVDDIFDESDYILDKVPTLDSKGRQAIRVSVKTRKRKFPANINGVTLVVEKS